SISDASEIFYEVRYSHRHGEALRGQWKALLDGALARERRKLADFERVAERALQAEAVRSQADALMSFSAHVPAGADTVELPNPAGGRGVIAISLDPALTPFENAARLYHKARTAQRGAVGTQSLAR